MTTPLPYTITTPRCHLRAAAISDLPALEHALALPQFPRKLPLSEMQRTGRLNAWLARFSALPDNGIPLVWAICLQGASECIGQVVLIERPGFDDYVLSFWLSPAHWGSGLATEAVAAVLEDGFMQRHIPSVWAGAATWNDASANLMLALGFQRVAYAGDGYVVDGEMQAIQAFACSKADWLARAA